MQHPLGRCQFGADQVLVDLGKFGCIGANAVDDSGSDRFPFQRLRSLDPVATDDQRIAIEFVRTDHDRLEQADVGYRRKERLNPFRLQRPQALRNVDVVEADGPYSRRAHDMPPPGGACNGSARCAI